ncbi:disease resistance protein RPM1 isoform X2 [Prunus yedoensis var. nudiflora]|uniref:Disease resistance protein RPM1 isoform X2 n=1 Tax=Prunus yedoensis var. nudiflora TaxID=2094558 RepID=A0A314U8L2_PRUYE|nr:disease resistance protein RPM1 isoform X2 [Prunus yedoensis var. nudiflora]
MIDMNVENNCMKDGEGETSPGLPHEPVVNELIRKKAIMATATTDLLIGKVVAILENEAASIAGVGHQVDEIKQELVFMLALLISIS